MCWLFLLSLGIIFGPKFLKVTSGEFQPPKGTPSAYTTKLFKEAFPEKVDTVNLIVFIANLEGESIECNATRQLTETIVSFAHNSSLILDVVGIYHANAGLQSVMQSFLLSPDGSATLIQLNVRNGVPSVEKNALIVGIRKILAPFNQPPFFVGLTGEAALVYDIVAGMESDLLHMDSVVIPVALFVLGVVLQSWRLMLIPLITVAMSLFVSFLIMYIIGVYLMDVVSIAPNIMMSLIIAMSIDYSLFLLTRYTVFAALFQ